MKYGTPVQAPVARMTNKDKKRSKKTKKKVRISDPPVEEKRAAEQDVLKMFDSQNVSSPRRPKKNITMSRKQQKQEKMCWELEMYTHKLKEHGSFSSSSPEDDLLDSLSDAWIIARFVSSIVGLENLIDFSRLNENTGTLNQFQCIENWDVVLSALKTVPFIHLGTVIASTDLSKSSENPMPFLGLMNQLIKLEAVKLVQESDSGCVSTNADATVRNFLNGFLDNGIEIGNTKLKEELNDCTVYAHVLGALTGDLERTGILLQEMSPLDRASMVISWAKECELDMKFVLAKDLAYGGELVHFRIVAELGRLNITRKKAVSMSQESEVVSFKDKDSNFQVENEALLSLKTKASDARRQFESERSAKLELELKAEIQLRQLEAERVAREEIEARAIQGERSLEKERRLKKEFEVKAKQDARRIEQEQNARAEAEELRRRDLEKFEEQVALREHLEKELKIEKKRRTTEHWEREKLQLEEQNTRQMLEAEMNLRRTLEETSKADVIQIQDKEHSISNLQRQVLDAKKTIGILKKSKDMLEVKLKAERDQADRERDLKDSFQRFAEENKELYNSARLSSQHLQELNIELQRQLELEMEHNQASSTSTKTRISELCEENQKLKNDIFDVSRTKTTLEQELATNSEALKQGSKQLSCANVKVQELEREIVRFTQIISQLREEKVGILTEKDGNAGEVKYLRVKLQETVDKKEHLQKELRQLNESNHSMTIALRNRDQSVGDLNRRLEAAMDAQTGKLIENETILSSLQTEKANNSKLIKELKQSNKEMEDELYSLKSSYSRTKHELQEEKALTRDNLDIIRELKVELEDSVERNRLLKNENDDLSRSTGNSSEEADQWKTDYNRLDIQYERCKMKLENTCIDFDMLKADHKRILVESSAKNEQIVALRVRNAVLQGQVEEMEIDLNIVRESMAALEDKNTAFMQTIFQAIE